MDLCDLRILLKMGMMAIEQKEDSMLLLKKLIIYFNHLKGDILI